MLTYLLNSLRLIVVDEGMWWGGCRSSVLCVVVVFVERFPSSLNLKTSRLLLTAAVRAHAFK